MFEQRGVLLSASFICKTWASLKVFNKLFFKCESFQGDGERCISFPDLQHCKLSISRSDKIRIANAGETLKAK